MVHYQKAASRLLTIVTMLYVIKFSLFVVIGAEQTAGRGAVGDEERSMESGRFRVLAETGRKRHTPQFPQLV